MLQAQGNLAAHVIAYGAYLKQTGDFDRIALQAYPLLEDDAGPVRIPLDQRENALAKVYAKHLATLHGGAAVEVAMHENERGGVSCIVKASIYDPEHGTSQPVRDMLWTRFMETNEIETLPGRSCL